jgi:hypothetical protein
MKSKINRGNAHKISAAFLNPEQLKKQEKFRQTIPKELMHALKTSAKDNNINLDIEVLYRLLATVIEPNAFGFSPEFDKIIHKQFLASQAHTESILRRNAWRYVYELEKLKLWVEFEDKLPKDFKECFSIIDVEKEIKALRAEKAQRDKENNKE